MAFRMQCLGLLALALCFHVVSCSSAGSYSASSSSVDSISAYDSTTFPALQQAPFSVVLFHGSKCSRCKTLLADFSTAQSKFNTLKVAPRLGRVNVTDQSAIAEQLNIKRIPDLKIYRNGQSFHYNGPRRDAELILEYLKAQAAPAVTSITNLREMIEKQKEDLDTESSVIAFFPRAEGPVYEEFKSVAAKLRDEVPFGMVIAKRSLCKKYGVKEDSEAVLFFEKDKSERLIFNDSTAISLQLEQFIRAHIPSAIPIYTDQISDALRQRGLPIGKLFLPQNILRRDLKSPHMQYYISRLSRILKEHKGKIVLTLAEKEKNKPDLDYNRLYDYSQVFVIEDQGKKFVYKEERLKETNPSQQGDGKSKTKDGKKSVADKKKKREETLDFEAVREFVDSFLQGDIRPYYRSLPEPANVQSKGIFTVVGSTFDEFVNGDDSLDVVLFFHAPYDTESKKWANELYPKLVKKYFADSEDFIFGQLDAVENGWDRTQFSVPKQPALYLKPAKKGAKPILYEEAKELWTTKGVYEWLRKNAKHKLKKLDKKTDNKTNKTESGAKATKKKHSGRKKEKSSKKM